MDRTAYPIFSPERSRLLLPLTIRRDPLGYFLQTSVESNGHAWFKLLGSPVLFLSDATAIEYVFSTNDRNYHKGKYNEGLRPILGHGVFLSEDGLWERQRRMTAPIFAGGNFPEFCRRMHEAMDALLVRWEGRDTIDIRAETMRLTLDVVLRALYHEDSEAALLGMRESLGTMLRMAEGRIWSLLNPPLKIALLRPRYRRTLEFLNELTSELIERRRANRAYPDDLLSRLIDGHENTPEDQILLRDNVLSFLLAGHETTANGLAWTFLELGKHTEIRRRAEEEIRITCTDERFGMEEIKKLVYTRQAFCEALRLYPPVWTMSRRALNDDCLPADDGRKIFVPKDSTVMLCGYTTQRREKYWHDPESFTPERFAPDAVAQRPRFSWFPFGGGPRLCLGFRFAEVESALALARIYQKYELSLIPGQQIKPEPIITLRPDRPVMFRIKKK